nr:MAG TPA: hypothetical protein [Caudoviricetes sp.]
MRNRKECKNEQCRNNSLGDNQKRNTEAKR